jgi:transcriptional regulator with XRE-family HTH domain
MKRQDIHLTMTAARLEAGLTQAELAKLMRTTQSTIARLETGGRYPNLTTLDKWAEVTGHGLEIRFIRH